MLVNRASFTLLLFVAASFLSVLTFGQNKKSRTRPVLPYNHATLNAPPGMVYIRGGSTVIRYNQSSTDTNSTKKVSLTSFFIDKTEITNQQYRQFADWVIDSIAIVKYLKDEKYFKSDRPIGSAETAAAPTDSTMKMDSTVLANNLLADSAKNDTIKRRIDWSKVSHRKIFESKDADVQSKIRPLLDENGNIKKDAYTFSFKYLKVTNSANVKNKVRQWVTETVSIYPDEKVWAEDLTNSQTDLLVENYFKAPPYDDYPVVGVTWKQARAFSYWRSVTAEPYANMPEFMKYYTLTYSLPSEAQWVYAASGFYDMIASNTDTAAGIPSGPGATPADSTQTPHDSATVARMIAAARAKNVSGKEEAAPALPIPGVALDSTPVHRDDKGLLANFKQDEGDYWEDGGALSLPVMSYAPNEFGLYNMEGNVSEWILDAYSPSTFSFVSDLNPALLYDADSTDADAMRRKVVRGGSFVSNARMLGPYYRDLELDNVAHCYIGFRCVMAAPEVLYLPVSTRGKRVVGKTNNRLNARKH